MILRKIWTLLWLAFAVSAAQAQPAPIPDAIYYGGPIITVNDRQPTAGAIATRNSLILAVGTPQQVFAYKGGSTRLIDLHGETLLPGFPQ